MRSRSWFLRMSMLSIAMTAVIGFIMLRAANLNGLSSLQSELEDFRPTIVTIRITAIVALAIVWPALVRWAAGRGYFSTASAQVLKAARWRCLTWLLCLELLIGMNVLEAAKKMLVSVLN